MPFKKTVLALTISIVILTNLFLGLSRLGTYSAVDEPYWTYGRTSKFWNAVADQRWRSTNVNDKPGITVAILSGFGLLKYDPMKYEDIRGDVKTDAQLEDIDGINFYFRLPIFLFCTLMLLAFYFLLNKLFGQTTALFGFVFIGLSPILLGISMIINPDSLLWVFLPLSLLSYFTFQKEQEKKYLVATGIFLGLSLLTKYVANILYIFFLILPFLEYILTEKKPELKEYLTKSLKNYFAIVAVSMLTFYLLFPATWFHPKVLLEGTFLSVVFEKTWPLFAGIVGLILIDTAVLKNKITKPILAVISKYKDVLTTLFVSLFIGIMILVLLNTYLGMTPFDLEKILSSPKGIGIEESGVVLAATGAILADMYSLIFGLHPVIFALFIVGLLSALKREGVNTQEKKIVLYFSLFILLYYIATTANNVVATIRYQIISYPLALIISAIGAKYLLSLEKVKKFITPLWTLVAITILLIISLLNIKPFYFAYASPLLPEKYLLNTKDMGDGSYEAAAYLNSLPKARNLTVWADKGAVCTEFIGKCNIGFSNKDLKGKSFDYFVISSGRESRSLKLSGSVNDIYNFKKIYDENTPYTEKITIGGRPSNFVKIIPVENIR